MSEAEVRFGVTNPILRAIARCTDTVLAAEESISTYEAQSPEAQEVIGETSHTPSQQKSISKDVRPDYVIYTLTSRDPGSAKISMVEVKRKSTFVKDRSICQTVGYNIATKYTLVVDDRPIPPLLILICEDELKFIFFPFIKDGSPCIDAILTPAIPIAESDAMIINESWFVFICFYIVGAVAYDSSLKPIVYDDSIGFAFHDKKSYEDCMEILDDRKRIDELEQQLKEAQEERLVDHKRIDKLQEENITLKRLVEELEAKQRPKRKK